ncbi:transglycosylase family protein [Streptomyces sp. SID3343]|uniref:transglycosylase family protein n=1 Tax=Streptomyces sp. SID3343 TaxID=2690260 RepID=UPI00136BF1B9|nr:transglycosylase family protein [Streptomyces sp. SID3343]MYV98986.1 LysM peptidoglycan-binding domain-containing protein [Streptomyces sp. SID3343]
MNIRNTFAQAVEFTDGTWYRLRDVTVVGVMAASLVGFAGVTSASAASDATWDRVARCESSGNWSAHTGNGYRGGLQFKQSTWRAHGGKGSPDKASRAEQIRVAEAVLKSQGPGAWPVCSKKAGLARGDDAPRTRPGTKGSKSSPRQQGPGSRSGGAKATRSGDSKATRRAATGSATKPVSAPEPAATDGADYTVQPGDTLSGIAAHHDLPGGYEALYARNLTVVGPDPDLIYPGQRLRLR